MAWVQVNKYHLKNGNWTISKSSSESSINPYGLHENLNIDHGYFKTADEAKAKYAEVNPFLELP